MDTRVEPTVKEKINRIMISKGINLPELSNRHNRTPITFRRWMDDNRIADPEVERAIEKLYLECDSEVNADDFEQPAYFQLPIDCPDAMQAIFTMRFEKRASEKEFYTIAPILLEKYESIISDIAKAIYSSKIASSIWAELATPICKEKKKKFAKSGLKYIDIAKTLVDACPKKPENNDILNSIYTTYVSMHLVGDKILKNESDLLKFIEILDEAENLATEKLNPYLSKMYVYERMIELDIFSDIYLEKANATFSKIKKMDLGYTQPNSKKLLKLKNECELLFDVLGEEKK